MMRRMRGFSWGMLLLALPVGGAIYGVYSIATHSKRAKPVASAPVNQAEGESEGGRSPASALDAASKPGTPASSFELQVAAQGDGQCTNLEFVGDGQSGGAVSSERWSKLMGQFHRAKEDLGTWLKGQKKHFTAEQLAMMEGQVKAIRIQRPPHAEEPDLHWRGILALSRDTSGEPLVRVGTGFFELLEKAPARARFELTRVLAQTWSPCELERLHVGKPWSGLLSCLGLEGEAKGCAEGSLSEGGWAISSVIASRTAPPGCDLPALSEEKVAGCLKKFPAPPVEMESDVVLAPSVANARKVAQQ